MVSGALLTDVERSTLEELARRARQAYGDQIEDIRLFGSRARGDVHVDSDIDVIVIVRAARADVPPLRRSLRDLASDLELANVERLDAPISLVVLSSAELAELRQRERRFARDVDVEGIPL